MHIFNCLVSWVYFYFKTMLSIQRGVFNNIKGILINLLKWILCTLPFSFESTTIIYYYILIIMPPPLPNCFVNKQFYGWSFQGHNISTALQLILLLLGWVTLNHESQLCISISAYFCLSFFVSGLCLSDLQNYCLCCDIFQLCFCRKWWIISGIRIKNY